jgi:capsular exopolysaccharide synthesis family protein
MSRIFDALQRSGAEQSGVEYEDMVSMAAVLESQREPVSAASVAVQEFVPATETLRESSSLSETATPTAEGISSPLSFPSVPVSAQPSEKLVFFSQPESLAAEKFRFLGVRLRQIRQTRRLKKVLVTSTLPEEGKSLVSANLSGVLARRKEKVLLIEGDLRRPTLSEQIGLGQRLGLAEWLQSGLDTPSNIYQLEGPGFCIMPAGKPPTNTLELMQSGRLPALLARLETLFDWIIVDSPPLLPLADTTVWSRLTDGTLLVAREGKTEKKPLERGLEMIKKSDLLGIVLNGCTDTDHDSYYQRYSPRTN